MELHLWVLVVHKIPDLLLVQECTIPVVLDTLENQFSQETRENPGLQQDHLVLEDHKNQEDPCPLPVLKNNSNGKGGDD